MPASTDPAANVMPIDVEQYLDIHESGALDGRRVELVDGELIEMHAVTREHWWATNQLGRHFVLALAEHREYSVGQQGGITAGGYSVPEPDLHVVRLRRADFEQRSRLPPSGTVLVGEVAVTSLRWDLGRKRRLYAEAAIPEYWVIDVDGERLVVHRDPTDGDYRTVTEHRRGEPVAPAGLPVAPFDLATALDPPAGIEA